MKLEEIELGRSKLSLLQAMKHRNPFHNFNQIKSAVLRPRKQKQAAPPAPKAAPQVDAAASSVDHEADGDGNNESNDDDTASRHNPIDDFNLSAQYDFDFLNDSTEPLPAPTHVPTEGSLAQLSSEVRRVTVSTSGPLPPEHGGEVLAH